MKETKVLVVMGSDSDFDQVKPAVTVFEELGIAFEVRVSSAHRTPKATADLAKKASDRGIRVIIAAAGGAHHLAGAISANTLLPVIALPIVKGGLGGLDALLSAVQMPPGVPVASVGMMGGAANAALFAASILALEDHPLANRLKERRQTAAKKVEAADRELQKKIEER